MIAEDASLPTRARAAISALKVLALNAGDEEQAALLNSALDSTRYKAFLEMLSASEEGRQLLAQRPSLQGPDLPLAQLEAMPEGTLGREFAQYFTRNKISPFCTTAQIRSDFDFVGKRFRETHDLLHVLTGYATDVEGEMELQAFLLGNLKLPSAMMILWFAVPGVLKKAPRQSMRFLGRLRRAFFRGRKTRELLSVPYEQHWSTPVQTLVAQLGLHG